MGAMWIQLIEAGILLSDFVYHRYIEDHPTKKTQQQIQLPLSGEGAPIPLLFGRCRVKTPVLAWASTPNLDTSGTLGLPALYRMSMLFIAGIPFAEQDTSLIDSFVGETRAGSSSDINLSTAADLVQGTTDLRDGNATQDFFNPSLASAADYMLLDPHNPIAATDIPSWRGYATVFLGHFGGAPGGGLSNDFVIGGAPSAPSVSFEIQTLPKPFGTNGYPGGAIQSRIVFDANPADVIWEILTGKFGKLGLDPSLLDFASFQAAAYTLWLEQNGYSRCFDEFAQALDMIIEILVQIDGVLYEDPATGRLGLRLVRNDYDPTTIPVIDKSNCSELKNLAIGGLTGLPNQIRISFTDRANNYAEGSARATNQGNAVGQGLVREQVVSMPGVTTQENADQLAERELAARTKPLIKCTAIVDGSFWDTKPGDVVKVVWQKPGISGLVFRVATVNRGTLEDGRISLDLIQDVFFVWRNRPPVNTGFGGHSSGLDGIGFGG